MADARGFSIVPVRSPDDLKAAVTLVVAYTEWLDLDLTFQDFQSEMAQMPGKYAPPKGELLIARNNQVEAIGCVALRPLDSEGCCEMKRLYVTPAGRGLGIGRALIAEILEVARKIGYEEMRLDTLPNMTKAIELYKSFGFVQTPKYYETPIEQTVFLSKRLVEGSDNKNDQV
jgi:ribosomal protein S18 acetylase RimI-like enzyme